MKIIKATANNAKDIANIQFNCGYAWSKYSLEKEMRLAMRLLKEGREDIFLVKEGKNFISYISIRIENSIGELGMSVLKNYQGKGIGSHMMEFIIEFAKKKRCKKLKLEVWEGNTSAIKLYQKFGFKIKSEEKRFYENGDSLLHMERGM